MISNVLEYLEIDIKVSCTIMKDEIGRTKSGHHKNRKQLSANDMKTIVNDASSLSSKITDRNNSFISYIPKTITNHYSFPLVYILKVIKALAENIN